MLTETFIKEFMRETEQGDVARIAMRLWFDFMMYSVAYADGCSTKSYRNLSRLMVLSGYNRMVLLSREWPALMPMVNKMDAWLTINEEVK